MVGVSSVSVWMNRQVTPATALLPNLQSLPAPVVAASYEPIPDPSSIRWVDRHGVEHVERLGTMEAVTDNQPPAPTSFAPAAATADAWPIVSPSDLNLR
jgi:hypothetical protein